MKEEIRTEEEIRDRLEWLQSREIHLITPLDGKKYTALVTEIYTLQWVLKEGGIE